MFKFSVILWLLVTGMAHASSESSLAHQNYTVKLNSMAAIVMDWYGSLLINKPHTFLKPLHTNLSEYPKQIKLIKITQTSLVSLDTFDQTQFIVEVAIKKDDLKSSKIHHLSDTFLF